MPSAGDETRAPPVRPLIWLLRALRPRDWLHFLALPLLSNGPPFEPWSLAVGVALAAGCLAFAYGLNNVSDAHLDHSSSKNPIVGESSEASLRALRILLVLIPLAAVGLAASVSMTLFALVAFQLVGSALYSSALRLKRLPFLGTATNVWIFAPLCFFGNGQVPESSHFALFVVLFSALLVQNQLIHELKDAAEDRAAAVVTTVVRFGNRRALRAILFFGLLSAVLILLLGYLVGQAATASLCALPVLLVSAEVRRLARVGVGDAARLQRTQRWAAAAAGATTWLIVIAA